MDNPLKGFDDIKANDKLIAKTKKRMLNLPEREKSSFSVKKPVTAAVSFVAVAAIIVFAVANGAGGKNAVTVSAQDLMKGITSQNVNVTGAVTDSFKRSTQNFSVNLFQKSYKNGENTLVSPTSACLALGMTANGSSGETQTAFLNVLGKYGMTVDTLNKAYKAYSEELMQKKGSTTVTIANSIWFDKKFAAYKGFLQTNADYFGATAQKLNFGDSKSVGVINNWVKSNTGGKIDKIIDKLDSDDVMHLINAIYFDAKWQNPFDKDSKPYTDIFTLDSGDTTKASYMSLQTPLSYVKGEKETAVLLPYDDGRYAMLLVLPNKGVKLSSYVSSMTETTIPDLTGKMKETSVSLTLPQFKTTFDVKLNDALKRMGLTLPFSNSADFSKMGKSGGELYISAVRQKTYLKVDELGTQAAAVTDVEMKESAIFTNAYINVNRPFVYAIIDTKTNLPLFIGAMQNPSCT